MHPRGNKYYHNGPLHCDSKQQLIIVAILLKLCFIKQNTNEKTKIKIKYT